MTTLVITRGLPASGKSTWARAWVAAAPRRVRVNRDDLRENLFGAPRLDFAQEQAVTTAQHAAVESLLRSGSDVVVDDTNLRAKFARAWADLAVRVGADLVVQDFLDVPLETCVERDAARLARGERGVGEAVLRDLHAKFLAGRGPGPVVASSAPGTPPASAYVPDPSLPQAWIVDVDGTLALMDGRGPYDWHRVGEDRPHPPVVDLVRGLQSRGAAIVVVSGRDGVCRDATAQWLMQHDIPCDELLMRTANDNRKDSIVKRELFDDLVRRWQVVGVLDDRDQVVRMWRDLGLMCAQVAPGDF